MNISIETACAALARAAWVRGESPDYSEAAVSGLLADIRHYCIYAGIDFGLCERRAGGQFGTGKGGAP